VKVATQLAAEVERDRDYEIVRLPMKSCMQLLRCPMFAFANVSLRGLPPMMIAGAPLVVSHQGTYDSPGHLSILFGAQEDCHSVQTQYLLQRSGTVAYFGTFGRHS
jgi:hypothetical protein